MITIDPNACRARMIEKANSVLAGIVGRDDSFVAAATDLAEAVHDLDEWLRAGGFLPTVWNSGDPQQPGRKQDVDIFVGEAHARLSTLQDDDRPLKDSGTPCMYATGEGAKSGQLARCTLDKGHEGAHSADVD